MPIKEAQDAAEQGLEVLNRLSRDLSTLPGWMSDLGQKEAADALRAVEVAAANARSALRKITNQ